MWGDLGWTALLVATIAIEGLSRLGLIRSATLSRMGALIATRTWGRLVLMLLWMFVGLHLFARYTIPGH